MAGALRIFVLNKPTPFPGELLTLLLWQGGALRLVADVIESGERTHSPHVPRNVNVNRDVDEDDGADEEPLEGVFGVASTADASHGAIARVDSGRPGGWERVARRVHVEIIGRYARAGSTWHTGAYAMARVRPLCERAPPTPISQRGIDAAFVPLRAPPRRRSRGALPPRRRPSAELGGLTYAAWRSVDATQLVARARTYSRRFFVSDIDALLSWPERRSCPARWSFWLAAAVMADPDEKLRMFRTTCTVTRLRFLLRILDRLEEQRNRTLSSSPLDSCEDPPCKYLRTRYYKPDIPSI